MTDGDGFLGTTAAAASERRRRMTAFSAPAGATVLVAVAVAVAVVVVVAIVLSHTDQRSPAMKLCQSSLGSSVVAASPTTVGYLRGWDTDRFNDPNPHPLQNAWPTSTNNDFAAYCTTGSSDVYTFYAVGPDRTAKELQADSGIQGPPPSIPPPHA